MLVLTEKKILIVCDTINIPHHVELLRFVFVSSAHAGLSCSDTGSGHEGGDGEEEGGRRVLMGRVFK